MELDRTERRVLGALMEKRWTTPEQYPLSFNALILACNQKSNRDPVLDLEEFEVRGVLLALMVKGLATRILREGGRTERYSERLTEELALDRSGSALLAELMLRGPQTAPELHRRAGRMEPSLSMAAVEQAFAAQASAGLVRLLPREPGQRHARWTHRLAPAAEVEAPPAAEAPAPGEAEPRPPAPRPPVQPAPDELAELRREIAGLRERIERLEASAAPPPSD
jgi:uncharacterized protein YceH (UPF0502 family)